MTATEVQLLVSVATTLCSGVVSAIVTHKLSSGRAEWACLEKTDTNSGGFDVV
jgi:hypothetical protein